MLKTIVMLTLLVLSNALAAQAAMIEKDAVVAVMDFGTHPGAASSDIALANAEGTTSEYVIARLINDGKMVVMDKENVRNQLEANNVKLTGLIDPDSAKVIGDVLNCQYIVYGNVNDVSVSNTGTKMLGPVGGKVNTHVIARIMNVHDGTIVMAAKGEGVSKSSYTDIHSLQGGIQIGTVTVTQESVHNALQKAAFNAVDILTQRLYGQK